MRAGGVEGDVARRPVATPGIADHLAGDVAEQVPREGDGPVGAAGVDDRPVVDPPLDAGRQSGERQLLVLHDHDEPDRGQRRDHDPGGTPDGIRPARDGSSRRAVAICRSPADA